MLTGSLAPQSRRATYLETLELTDADPPHDLLDWGGVTAARVAVCDVEGHELLVATLGAGVTLPADGILAWRFEAAALGALEADVYRVLVSVTASDGTASDGQVVELVDALLPLT